nr:unnamed protein product [Callosobruchus analis]
MEVYLRIHSYIKIYRMIVSVYHH